MNGDEGGAMPSERRQALAPVPARLAIQVPPSVRTADRTMLRDAIESVEPRDAPRLVAVWEASVRATHHFLSEADIAHFRPLVRQGLVGSLEMACVRDADGQVAGFIGVAGRKIEALFVHPAWRGAGIGRRLTEYAITQWGVDEVDVNEQNEQAVGFYHKMNFPTRGRSPVDGLGNPFPLLHLKRSQHRVAADAGPGIAACPRPVCPAP